MEKVSVIIPTIKGREHLLDRLIRSLPSDCEIIVVADEHLPLASKRNKGAAQASGEYLLFIDDDNYLIGHSFFGMMLILNNYNIGIVGMVACYAKDILKIADGGSVRHLLSGFTIGSYTNWNIIDIQNKYLLSPQCYVVDEAANAFMIRRDLFLDVGGFDETHFPIDLDEADLCLRVKRKGYQIAYTPFAQVIHDSITYSRIPDFRRPLNAYMMGRNRVLFQRKHLSPIRFSIYVIAFLPIFVISYCLSLLYRRKPIMIYHFLKGAYDGLQGRLENTYQ
jgi:GT2 family glycosyltransferase